MAETSQLNMKLVNHFCAALRGSIAMVIDMKQTIQTRDQQLDEYRQILAGVDMPEKEKDDVIRVVESIMRAFVDAAFNIHPAQISSLQRICSASQVNSSYDNLDIGARISTSTESGGGAPEDFGI